MGVSLNVGNIRTNILGYLSQDVVKALDIKMSWSIDGAWYSEKCQKIWCPKCRQKCEERTASFEKSGVIVRAQQIKSWFCETHGGVSPVSLWDGRQHLFSTVTLSFPTGLIHYCREVLKKNNISYKVLDNRVKIQIKKPQPLYGITYHDYQESTIKKAIYAQRGIIQAPTGSGKTEIFTGITAELGLPTVIYCHRTTILHQTKERMEKRLKIPIGILGDGLKDIKKYTVAMIQSVFASKDKKVQQMARDAECIIFDEGHHLSATTVYKIAKISIQAYYRYCITATPWRDDGMDMMLEAATAKKIVQIQATDLIQRGILSKPYIYFLKMQTVSENDSRLSYPSIYQKCVVENDYRNRIATYLCNYLHHREKTVLVAVMRIEHGQRLLQIMQELYPNVRSRFIQGENDTEEKKQALKDLDERKLDVCIATTVFGEGVDVPSLDVLINMKAATSSVDTFQLVGRVMRTTAQKKKCFVIDFYDEGKYLQSHADARIKILKTEPEYEVEILDDIEVLVKTLSEKLI